MACDCGKVLSKTFNTMTVEVKRLRQTLQDLTEAVNSMNEVLGRELEANKDLMGRIQAKDQEEEVFVKEN